MAIVRSFGTLQASRPRAYGVSSTSTTTPTLSTYGYASDYAAIYASQPNVRICVDFLARNCAQVGYHVFRRVSDTDRQRLAGHELAQWLEKPNPYTTRYRLFESFFADLALYFNAYLLKVRNEPGAAQRIGLVRLPPPTVEVKGGYLPSQFVWTDSGEPIPLAPSEVVYANGYNPLNALKGLSPIETLRRILAEDIAAGDHQAAYWRNSSRMEAVIERPATAPKWTPAQKLDFRAQWASRYAGQPGQVPVLEEGMTLKTMSYSPRDSEYLGARQLTREECAREWHIPLPMVGILEHATFSNIKEQHKQLYADCLGPWFEMVSEAFELWLLPEARDTENVYGEFNIAEKLKGSFEEQANALRLLVGRPVMTANEGRARLNLPRITDDPSADQLAAQQGGPSNADAPTLDDGTTAPPPSDARYAERQEATTAIVRAHLARQASRVRRYPVASRADALDLPRCVAELAADLTPVLGAADAWTYAARITDHTYTLLVEGADAFSASREIAHAA
jgi:HK97 family phage portal protein